MTWRELNNLLATKTETELQAMLNEELAGRRRVSFIERIHQRFTVMRATRERFELFHQAAKQLNSVPPVKRKIDA